MMKQREMSAYEYAQVNNFIYRLYKKYGKGLEYEECRSIGFLEYVEVRRQYGDEYNSEYLWFYAAKRIINAFGEARRVRNERIHLEARLSLNQCIGESKEPVYTFLPTKRNNFDRSVCLWCDLKKFEKMDYQLLRGLYWGADDWELIDWLRISTNEYFEGKCILKENLQEYLVEWM